MTTHNSKKPNLDYPNLSLPDIEEDSLDYPLWEQNLEKEIQGIFDRELSIDDEIPDELIAQAETALGM